MERKEISKGHGLWSTRQYLQASETNRSLTLRATRTVQDTEFRSRISLWKPSNMDRSSRQDYPNEAQMRRLKVQRKEQH